MNTQKKRGRLPAQPPDDIKEKARMYFDENMSISEIAKHYNTYPKQIERELKRGGYELRNRSSAQKIRLDMGKAPHPTEGKEMSEETKIKISDKLHEAWKNFSDEEIERRRELARENLNNRPDKDRMTKLGQEAIKKAAIDGSALEKYIAQGLNNEGFYTLVHQKHIIQNKKMHLDILLPKDGIAIEIDGPAHHSELWEEHDVAKVKARDSSKDGLLLLNGYNVIRVKQDQTISNHFKRNCLKKVLETVQLIKGTNKKSQVYNI